jgi:hypothetical protein
MPKHHSTHKERGLSSATPLLPTIDSLTEGVFGEEIDKKKQTSGETF